ncbi:hypothetical protein P4H71_07075 [Paenibacillus kribbensis]|uniref:hypothetical protein n=1 Tax=Paenibacillus kribbensis TaxID=172713 RepID=UPI002DBCAA18|nr:hypothetical protein [Paenibacillus kribbensis]MEC0234093.1 hypothetical protein [Paenibacillus kribbensis]
MNVMSEAVVLARTFTGDWVARMALALKTVWRKIKEASIVEKEIVFETVKRGVEITIYKVGEKFEMSLDGDVCETFRTTVRGSLAWSVPVNMASKHFGVDKAAWLEEKSVKKEQAEWDKKMKENARYMRKERKKFFGEVE